jgi:ZIP family zinc transporter
VISVAVKLHNPIRIVIGFSFGLIVMLTIMYFTEKLKEQSEKKTLTTSGFPDRFIAGVGIDTAIDGLLLGIGFAAGSKAGMLLSFALATENLTLSLATASSLGKINFPVKKSIVVIFVLAAIFLGTTVLGNTLLSHLSDANLEMVLSFGLAALLFLVTEELLVKAHEQRTPFGTLRRFF